MHNRYSFFPFRFPRKIASDISLIFITLPSLSLLFFFHILLTLCMTWNTQRAIRGFINRVTDSNKLGVRAGFFSSLWPRGNYIKVAICKGWKEDFPSTKNNFFVCLPPRSSRTYLKMNLYVTPNRKGLAKFPNFQIFEFERGVLRFQSLSRVQSRFKAPPIFGTWRRKKAWKRGQFGNWVDATSHGRSPLKRRGGGEEGSL